MVDTAVTCGARVIMAAARRMCGQASQYRCGDLNLEYAVGVYGSEKRTLY
jgi:hypothetical protein